MKNYIFLIHIHINGVKKMKKRTKIPSKEEYRQALTRLIEKGDFTTLVSVRMGCEMGMPRIEVVNARVSDIDRFHKRGLWIEKAKKVRRGHTYDKKTGKRKPVFEMRQREIPINPSLYQLIMNYIDKDQMYILKRDKGDLNKSFSERYINTIYESAQIDWSPHKSRHFFKDCIADWMRANRQVDLGLIKELMGHKKNQTEDYGGYSWDYKLEVIDNVFP